MTAPETETEIGCGRAGTGAHTGLGRHSWSMDDDPSDDGVRCWLVERTFDDRNLVTLVYATPDGERHLTKQLSFQLLSRQPTTAGVDVDPEKLEPTAADERDRYATQARSMAEQHDPDDEV